MDDIILNQTGDMAAMLLCFPHLQDSCPRFVRLTIVRVVMYAFMVITILMTVCGNLLVIISITHFKQLHSPTNFILRSLAVVDCCLGCFVMPFSMVRSVEGCWYMGENFCKVHSSLDMMLCTTSILHLCLVSIDRYYAICDPLQYSTKVTVFKVISGTIIIWLFSFLFCFGVVFSGVNMVGLETFILMTYCEGSCALFFNKEWGIIAPTVSFYIPAAVMTCLYIKIFHVARKHAKVMSDRLATVTCSELKNQASEQRERKAAKTLAIVMGVFLLCWLPYFISALIDPFVNFQTPVVIFDALVWFAYFNSTCNPVIYAFFYPHFRKAFKIIIAKISGMRTNTHILVVE
ncbi:trace amine-associated receptor 4-like isoform X1 [Chanos chanos]|uniref:Trace amine-associated receptor 4-like isoform X1 n=2 Tax=Chanos chanos TaxID=29144 RepID=A0A6J2W405_CHACN|nr:trace amine-associated receptor 4-like isoform X1 [Chanos chanos]